MQQEMDRRVALNESDLVELGQQLAEAVKSGLPLNSGLRALLADTDSKPLKHSLKKIVTRLDQGEAIEDVLRSPGVQLPGHLTGLISAGLKSNSLGTTLERFVLQTQRMNDLKRECWLALTYPAFLFCLAITLFWGLNIYFIPMMHEIYDGFVELPGIIKLMVAQAQFIADYQSFFFGLLAAFVLGIALCAKFKLGERVLRWIPIIGLMFHWSALSEAYHLLALMIRQQIPLPLALRLTAESGVQPHLGQQLEHVAQEVENGAKLGDAIRRFIPSGFGPVILWGELQGSLNESLEMVADITERRAKAATQLVRAALPPLLLILVAILVFITVMMVFMPLLAVLNNIGLLS